MNAVVKSRYPADYPKLQSSLPGRSLAWLQNLRANAFDRFAEQGFPANHEEEWRYTNLTALEKKPFQLASKAIELSPEFLARHRLADTWTVVLVNGYFNVLYSILDGLPKGVEVLSLAEALEKQDEALESNLGRIVNDEHNLLAFNTAWFSDGVLLKVPAKQVLTKPLHILHVVTESDALVNTRNLLLVEAFAELTIIETFVASAGPEALAYLSTSVSEVGLSESAHLEYYSLQAEAEQAYHYSGLYVKQAKTSNFKHHQFAFGALLARSDIDTQLSSAAECELNGLYSGVKRQHLDNHTRITHLEPHAISREMYKGILDERARGVFQGRVIVAEHAQKTDSQMNNRNLLLSNDAEADTKPQLEIYADDVKCAHGVTVGQLEEKSIFYLQSRGVDAETARNMLTFAFANEMVEKISCASFHDQVLHLLLQRFPQQGIEQEWL